MSKPAIDLDGPRKETSDTGPNWGELPPELRDDLKHMRAMTGNVPDADESWKDKEAIVVDNGSYNIKAGISGEDAPEYTFRTVLGERKNNCTSAPRPRPNVR